MKNLPSGFKRLFPPTQPSPLISFLLISLFFPSWVFCICGLGQQVLPNVSIGHISTVESEKGPFPPPEAAGFGRFNHFPVVLGLLVRPDNLFHQNIKTDGFVTLFTGRVFEMLFRLLSHYSTMFIRDIV